MQGRSETSPAREGVWGGAGEGRRGAKLTAGTGWSKGLVVIKYL